MKMVPNINLYCLLEKIFDFRTYFNILTGLYFHSLYQMFQRHDKFRRLLSQLYVFLCVCLCVCMANFIVTMCDKMLCQVKALAKKLLSCILFCFSLSKTYFSVSVYIGIFTHTNTNTNDIVICC